MRSRILNYLPSRSLSVFTLGVVELLAVSASAITFEEWADDKLDNGVDATWVADPDGDGITNLREYAFNLDPEWADVEPVGGGAMTHSDGKDYLYIQFPIRTDATDLWYEVRGADDVPNLPEASSLYRTGPDGASGPGFVGGSSGTAIVADLEHALSSDTERRFLQLFIELASPDVGIDFVTVGDPGNSSNGGHGSVPYAFEIGKYEITNDQYVEFLNAIGASDTSDLVYNSGMSTNAAAGIIRHGDPGDFTYSVRPKMGSKPANHVRFVSAVRFCNWLHNGKPTPTDRSLQPGATEDGAYDLTDPEVVVNNAMVREENAAYFIPNEDEWYKAAYYDGALKKSWKYATQSDSVPDEATADSSGNINNDSDNIANYNKSAIWDSSGNGSLSEEWQGTVTTVGSGGVGSESYYGARDMSGNVFEWVEERLGSWGRIDRGGAFFQSEFQIANHYRHPLTTSADRIRGIGLRIARMP